MQYFFPTSFTTSFTTSFHYVKLRTCKLNRHENVLAYYVQAKAIWKRQSYPMNGWVVSPNWILRNKRNCFRHWVKPWFDQHCALNARQAFGLLSPQPWNGKFVWLRILLADCACCGEGVQPNQAWKGWMKSPARRLSWSSLCLVLCLLWLPFQRWLSWLPPSWNLTPELR